MKKISKTTMLLGMMLPAALLLLWPSRAQNNFSSIPQPAPGGTRGPSALLFAPDGRTLYVAEQDENQIAILNPDSIDPISLISSGGEQPVGLALSPDNRMLAVVNSFSGDLSLLDLEKKMVRERIRLPGMPYGVVIPANGRAFVSVSQRDEVAVVELGSGKVAGKVSIRIPVGHHPRALLLTQDGSTILCAGMADGTLSVIDTTAAKVRGSIKLPAVNLRSMVLSADGTHIYVTGQQPHNDLPTDKPDTMWTNVLCVARYANGIAAFDRVVTLDQPGRGAADPCGISLNSKSDTAYIALSGTHEVLVVPLQSEGATSQRLIRIPVGVNPRPLARRPHSDQIWVGNHLGNSLSVLNSVENTQHLVDLGAPTPSPNRRLRGRFLFSSAHLTRGMRFSCETCHPDGGADGLSWKFMHISDGLTARNTRDLRGPILLTGPYGWSGRSQDFENFVNDEIIGVLKTHKLPHSDVHAFWDLVNETPLPPNPYRAGDGTLTLAAARGKVLFMEKAGCISCHAGDQHGGANKPAWIGTSPPGIKIDVPHLIGVYDSAPYLHDGRSATLEEIFTKYDTQHLHGAASKLTSTQFQDLLEYVREL